jgi:hypothetical protein
VACIREQGDGLEGEPCPRFGNYEECVEPDGDEKAGARRFSRSFSAVAQPMTVPVPEPMMVGVVMPGMFGEPMRVVRPMMSMALLAAWRRSAITLDHSALLFRCLWRS